MNGRKGWLKTERRNTEVIISAGGDLTVEHIEEPARVLAEFHPRAADTIEVDFRAVERMDTAGALIASQCLRKLEGFTYRLAASEQVESMLEILERYRTADMAKPPRQSVFISKLEGIGAAAIEAVELAACFVVFIGEITRTVIATLFKPARFRFGQLVKQIEVIGFNAIPIIALISFLIGIVVAYQGTVQLGKLGADVYTIDLLSITILRELGILLAAIVIAGRSGSTFAAEIGSMKLNQELDAMRTIGINPLEMLVIPRVIGLMISLPILTLAADGFGVLGGSIMVWILLDISPDLFMHRFVESVTPWTFWVGIVKAPVFAAIIGIIGCYEGLQVGGSSESLGSHTTRAVVESIFMIIVFDALFSIFFGLIGI